MADQSERRTPWGDISHLTESGSNFPFPWEARTYLPEGEDPRTTLSGEHEVWSADDQIVAEVDARQVADMIAAVGDLYEAANLALEHLIALQVSTRGAGRYDGKWEGAAEAMQPAIDQARAALAKADGRDTGGEHE